MVVCCCQLWLSVLVWAVLPAQAQDGILDVSTDKTVTVVFPFAVKHVDRGHEDLLVSPVDEAENILLVKAGSPDMAETNLSVVTDDGSVYALAVRYAARPVRWVHYLPEKQSTTIATYAKGILDNPPVARRMVRRRWGMEARVAGIYTKDGVLYFQLALTNRSAVDYDIELLKFYIRDRKQQKRTAVQERELSPLDVEGNTKLVRARGAGRIVVALKKFTIPDAKNLVIQIMEKDGGRHFEIKVHNGRIVRARPLPDLR